MEEDPILPSRATLLTAATRTISAAGASAAVEEEQTGVEAEVEQTGTLHLEEAISGMGKIKVRDDTLLDYAAAR